MDLSKLSKKELNEKFGIIKCKSKNKKELLNEIALEIDNIQKICCFNCKYLFLYFKYFS